MKKIQISFGNSSKTSTKLTIYFKLLRRKSNPVFANPVDWCVKLSPRKKPFGVTNKVRV